jgi:long-chain acyl-CoA synthetase
MSDSIGIQIAIQLIKSLVFIYDCISYPIYLLVQKPWNLLSKSNRVKAKQLNELSPYSSWTRIHDESADDVLKKHFINECKTVSQFFSKAVHLYNEKKCFGFRPVLGEEDEKQSDGKIFKKSILGDYHFYSYEQIEQRVHQISCGLLSIGIRSGDNVLIFAETRLEWMLSSQAIFRIGATVATLYATLGDEGIVHGINETEVTHIITNYDLLPKLKRLESRIPLVQCIVYMEGFKPIKSEDWVNSKIKLLSFSTLEQKGKENKHLKGEEPKPNDTAGNYNLLTN